MLHLHTIKFDTMHNKITTLLHNYNFNLLQQNPMLDESDRQVGTLLDLKYMEVDILMMYYTENEIYLLGQNGLVETSLQSQSQAETIASLPYALQQITTTIKSKSLAKVA